MFVRLLISVVAIAALIACQKKPTEEPVAPDSAAPTADSAAAEPAPDSEIMAAAAEGSEAHSVACACSLGKTCSNVIEVEGDYVPLTGETGLEEMAFCGKEGLKAKVEGEMEEGNFVATSFELVE